MCSRIGVARSSPEPWRRSSVARSRRRRQALRASRTVIRSRVHSGEPSSLSPQPNCPPRAEMDSLAVAHTPTGAKFGVRAAEDGHCTHLRAHGCMAVDVGCCCRQPTQCKPNRILAQPSGNQKKNNHRRGIYKKRRGATVKANTFNGTVRNIIARTARDLQQLVHLACFHTNTSP